ncbi:MAG: MFS transporter, partial [Candidatus Binatia bacterium]|nr:MFS transporter [Candidatus Binatia bacterium]
MSRFAIPLYALASVCQASASSGSAMLAPFFMKERGFSVALVGVPLFINGLGRIFSDLLSGVLATYMSSGLLLIVAVAVALVGSLFGIVFRDVMPFFLGIWAVLGFSEAMFGLCIRKITFDQSPPDQQGKAQGQVAAALGIGFTLGPALGGWVGSRWGADVLFIVYAAPQALALAVFLLAGSHRVGRPAVAESEAVWREGRRLLGRPSFFAACLGIFQTFLFLVGVTRVAFPFL